MHGLLCALSFRKACGNELFNDSRAGGGCADSFSFRVLRHFQPLCLGERRRVLRIVHRVKKLPLLVMGEIRKLHSGAERDLLAFHLLLYFRQKLRETDKSLHLTSACIGVICDDTYCPR